jgi:hypothetical protein
MLRSTHFWANIILGRCIRMVEINSRLWYQIYKKTKWIAGGKIEKKQSGLF